MLPDKLTPEELARLLTLQISALNSSESATDLHLLRLMPEAARAQLMRAMTRQTYTRGDVIFHEGTPGDVAYLIWSGEVLVIKGGLHSPTILGSRGPGEILGEMALLENQPRSASVIALTDLRLLEIHKTDFTRLLSDTPSIGVEIMATMSARLRAADTIRDTTTQVSQRLTRKVFELQSREQCQPRRAVDHTPAVHPINIISSMLGLLDTPKRYGRRTLLVETHTPHEAVGRCPAGHG